MAYDMLFIFKTAYCRGNSGIVAFRGARGKNDFVVVFRADKLRYLVAGRVNSVAVLTAEGVHAGRVAVLLGKVRQHGIHYGGSTLSGGIVI